MKRFQKILGGLGLAFAAVAVVASRFRRHQPTLMQEERKQKDLHPGLFSSLATRAAVDPVRDFITYYIAAPIFKWTVGITLGLVLALAVFAIFMLFIGFPTPMAAVQPIAFPHATHVVNDKISCQYCHQFASKSSIAGIPNVQTCIYCHRLVIPANPEIQKLQTYWQEQQPIPWLRVTYLPDFVYFTHDRHVNAGVDCLECHKPNPQNDPTELYWFQTRFHPAMGYCLDCHKARGAPVDCYTCHR
jgi:hypothetical protein